MKKTYRTPIYNWVLAAMFTALTVVCTYIQIPFVIPFTLQTLAVFLCCCFLSIRYSLMSLTAYVLLGVVGLPVFSGFQSGMSVIAGPTGGYILGFYFIIVSVGLCKRYVSDGVLPLAVSMVLGLVLCYLTGTLWYAVVTKVYFVSALAICVLPYVVFDGAKIVVTLLIYNKIKSKAFAG